MRLGVAIFVIGWVWFCVEALLIKDPSYPRQVVAVSLTALGYYVAFTAHGKLSQLVEELRDEEVQDENID